MRSGQIPLWVKIGPELGAAQYEALMEVFAEVGVGAVIATNTLARPVMGDARGSSAAADDKNTDKDTDAMYSSTPTESSSVGTPYMASVRADEARPAQAKPSLNAGVGGGSLHTHALDAVRHLAVARERLGAQVCIVGCGGVLDGESARALLDAGADALQYWSALIYRGPLAAAVIQREIEGG